MKALVMLGITILVVVGFTALLARGQEAKIMIVDKSDSDHLAKAYKTYQDAKKQWEDVKVYVAEKYTIDQDAKPSKKDGKVEKAYIPGWEKVQFSADFRALVPDSSQYASRGCYYGSSAWITPSWNAVNTSAAITGSSDLAVNPGGSGTVLQAGPSGPTWAPISIDEGIKHDLTTKEREK